MSFSHSPATLAAHRIVPRFAVCQATPRMSAGTSPKSDFDELHRGNQKKGQPDMPFEGLLWHPQKTYPINVWFLLAYYQLTPRRLLECKHDIGKVLFFTYIHICIKITFIGWRLDTLRAFQVPVFQHSLCRWSLEVRYVPYCSYMVSNFGFMLTSDFGWNYTRKSTPCFLRHDMFEAQKCRTDDGHRLIFFLPDRGAKFVARKAIWRMYAPWRLHKNWDQVGGSPLGKILGELSEAEKFTICIGQLANLSSNALMYWYGRSYIPKSLGWRVSLQQISKNRKLNKYTHTHTYIGVTSVLKFLKGFGMWNTLRVLFPVCLWRRPFFSFVVWSYYDFEIRLMKWGWWALSLGGASGICYMHL